MTNPWCIGHLAINLPSFVYNNKFDHVFITHSIYVCTLLRRCEGDNICSWDSSGCFLHSNGWNMKSRLTSLAGGHWKLDPTLFAPIFTSWTPWTDWHNSGASNGPDYLDLQRRNNPSLTSQIKLNMTRVASRTQLDISNCECHPHKYATAMDIVLNLGF